VPCYAIRPWAAGGPQSYKETTPRCWTQQGPIYSAELGCPPPDPDSINLAAAAGGNVGFALTTYVPVQLEI